MKMKIFGLHVIIQTISIAIWAFIYSKSQGVSSGEAIMIGMIQGWFIYKLIKEYLAQ